MSKSRSEELARLIRMAADQDPREPVAAAGADPGPGNDGWESRPIVSVDQDWAVEPSPPLTDTRRRNRVAMLIAGGLALGAACGAAAFLLSPIGMSDSVTTVSGSPPRSEVPSASTVSKAFVLPSPPASEPPATAQRELRRVVHTPPALPELAPLPPGPTAEAPAPALVSPAAAPESAPATVPPSLPLPSPAPTTLAKPSAPSAPPAKAVPESRILSREEAAGLIRRGQEILKTGDIASARLFFRRAAEGSDPIGALLYAATYDPNMLSLMKARGNLADAEMARIWYERAKALGAPEAEQRLAALDRR